MKKLKKAPLATISPQRFKNLELTAAYEPEKFEGVVYEEWESTSAFQARLDEDDKKRPPFSMVLPPPNVTGVLHMGHALTATLQDILTRWHRMRGFNTLWLPGLDHAGIATQAQVEKQIAKEGKGPTGRPLSRYDLGREAFVKRVWKWKEDHEHQIKNQHRRLGVSFDWSKERFTLDEGFSRAVRKVFVDLYQDGLIYRGERIINWCPRCQTALSDLEVVPKEKAGSLWQISYAVVEADGSPVIDAVSGNPAQVVIATTRPETLLGDSAVAVHPEDERYQKFHGKHVKLPILGRILPLILDSYVDREFGSGALKVTPAHDFNDYELGKRHDLPMVSVMGKDGKITAAGGPFAGVSFAEAREKVIVALKEEGSLVGVQDHRLNQGLCQRCDAVAEPIISKQWFVKIEPLAKKAIEAVENGDTVFYPRTWEKTYFEWMRNIRDWCISRQLWWGHQIPAWYCNSCSEITVVESDPKSCKHCDAPFSELKRDEDVLDTWFSSGLWPFATLGWPENTEALKRFYPTSILETGFDIIFFWVSRMMMLGLHFMKEVPFRRVYLHAMVRDEKGEKMSKSKGNVIDPLVLVEQYGADPLRLTLAAMAGQGRDIKLSVDRVEGYRAFCNKIWNAVKFLQLQCESEEGKNIFSEISNEACAIDLHEWCREQKNNLAPMHRWILSRLNETKKSVYLGFENFEIDTSTQALYDFTWHEVCDWYIEFCKIPFRSQGQEFRSALFVLHVVLDEVLKLLHPIIPHVTERLWQKLPLRIQNSVVKEKSSDPESFGSMLCVQGYPECEEVWLDQRSTKRIDQVKSVVGALRNFKGENRLSPKTEFLVEVYVSAKKNQADLERPEVEKFFEENGAWMAALAKVTRFEVKGDSEKYPVSGPVTVISLAEPSAELRISLKGLVDLEEERKRLSKEIEKVRLDLNHVEKKLSQESFIQRAPTELVSAERLKAEGYRLKMKELEASLARISS